MSFDEAVENFPLEFINTKPPNVAYTPYQLLEHIRRTQADLLEYITNSDYTDKDWPKDYWPEKNKKASAREWRETIERSKKDQATLKKIVQDNKINLFQIVGGNPDHTIFREIILAGDHNSYHLGEFATWRDIMKTWPKDRIG